MRFEARVDGGSWRPVDAAFPWAIHDGANRLDVRTVNHFGVMGAVSSAGIDVQKTR
jgi:hypothetical protein